MKLSTPMTISFSKGKKSETSISHNNRSLDPDFDFSKAGHDHIKPEFTPLNEVLIHENIHDVYEREFGAAVAQYNSQQKRKDRRIDDYYSKVLRAKNQRTQYEFLVQVGNQSDFKDDKNRTTSQLWQNGKKILENYFADFQKRNPNLIVYNAAIHMDEQGAPHMHMNIVPVAHVPDAKRGLTVKPSLNKALAEEGYPISQQDNRQQWRDFQHREADALAEQAHEFGITRKRGIVNKLKDVHEYKQAMRQIDAEKKRKIKLDKEMRLREKNYADRTKDLQKKYQADREKYLQARAKARALTTAGSLLTKYIGEMDDFKHIDRNDEQYLVTGALGKVDKPATLRKIHALREQAKAGQEVNQILNKSHAYIANKELTWNNDNLHEVEAAVDHEVAPLKQTIAKQKQEIAEKDRQLKRWRNFGKAVIGAVRTFAERVNDKATELFYRALGSKFEKNKIDERELDLSFTPDEQKYLRKGRERHRELEADHVAHYESEIQKRRREAYMRSQRELGRE